MNTELIDERRRRAAKHAALADPARLAIIDTLSVSDASPRELQAMLGMTSNLLAHHLNVLDAEGMVIRHRSEADRRRTYLRLAPGALDGLTPRAARTARRVLFVCTANSARSHLAAALWRQVSDVPAASAGTHPAAAIDPGAIDVAERHGLLLRRLRPKQIDEVHADGDLLITVCDHAHEKLHTPAASGLHWSVPDPVPVGTTAAFDTAYDDLTRRVSELAPHLRATAS